MQEKPKVVLSKNSRDSIYGHILEPGDTLAPTDRYDSTNGTWELCPCPGLVLQEGNAAVWVRPCA